jgi:hypothetical protein
MTKSTDLDRRPVAVLVTTDGRRVQVPLGVDEVPPLSLIRAILVGIESLVALITGDRRENRGTRRNERQ